MTKRMTITISFLLLMLCGCSKDASNAAFLAARSETVLAEIPETSEDAALQYLKDFHTDVNKSTNIPGEGRTTVKYHTGLSHTSEGLVVKGSKGGDPSLPPDKSYYHEFHYDQDGKLSHIVENNEGARALSNLFYYDGPNPMARLCFVQGSYNYSDLACYAENTMFFKCRITADGKVLSKRFLSKNP